MREKVFRFLAKLSVFLTIWTAVLGAGSSAHAAGMLYMRDVMARLQTSTSGEHTITFQLPAAIAVGGQIDLRFTTSTAGQSNFTFAAGASTTRDIDITTSTATGTGMNVSVDTCTGTYAERNPVTTTATTADGNFWGFTSSVQSGGFTITLDQPTTVALPINTCVRVRIGDNTSNSSDVDLLTNPASTTNTSTQLYLTISNSADSGALAYAIVTDDQPLANATNTPSMTADFDVQTTACTATTAITGSSVGTMNFYDLRADGVVNTRSILCTRITSNAVNGVTVQMRSALGQMTSTALGRTSAFPAAAQTGAGVSTTVNVGSLTSGINTSTEAYGYCLIDDANSTGTGSGVTPASAAFSFSQNVASGTCTNDSTDGLVTTGESFKTLTDSLQPVWTSSGAVYRSYANFVLKAAVTATTPADNLYADTITVIAFATY